MIACVHRQPERAFPNAGMPMVGACSQGCVRVPTVAKRDSARSRGRWVGRCSRRSPAMAAGEAGGWTRWMRPAVEQPCFLETDTGRVSAFGAFCMRNHICSVGYMSLGGLSGVPSGCLRSAVGITLRREGDVRTENSPLLMTVSVRWTFVRSKVEYHQTYPT